MMLEKEELEKIKKKIESEFLNDFALQQIHITRKIIAKEAEMKDLSYLDYTKLSMKDVEAAK